MYLPNWTLIYLLSSSFLTSCASSSISNAVKKFIGDIVSRCEQNQGNGFSDIINPPIAESDIDSFCMPSIILWNPYLIYPQLISPEVRKCHCGKALEMKYWNDGSCESKQPRILHGIKNIVYLVSAVYICENNHKIMAHDEIILDSFPCKAVVPFILFHHTGFTRQLTDMVLALVRKGINFYNIESLILEQRWEHFARQQDIHVLDTSSINFFDMPLSKSPSNDILSKAFLATFLENEQLYLREMINIPIEEAISFDHTFKVAANIGYLREDGRWITEYDGLFLVINNNNGQVLTWQLTKRTSFADIEVVLKNLHGRSQSNIKTIYVDNCCKLRNKIKGIFGSDIKVKLDLFHAVQRVSKTFSRKNALTRQCLHDLRLVFRCDGDIEEQRKSSTPSSEIMNSKLDQFITKWEEATDSKSAKLFRPDTNTALINIKQHIASDCLSDIPPGGGTNKNERFHEHLNSFFHRSRIGILLAYALLTVVIHSHNASVKTHGKLVARPITACLLRKIPMNGNLEPIGIIPKKHLQQQNTDHWEIDISSNIIDMELIIPTFERSIQKFQVKKALEKMKMFTLSNSVSKFTVFEKASSIYHENNEVNDLPKETLLNNGLTLHSINPDGNCCFKAIATNIIYDLDAWKQSLIQADIMVDEATQQNLNQLAVKLRNLFVKEILGEHRSIYESFTSLNAENYETEAKNILQDGFFYNIIGDLMPLALATALQASLVIVTNNNSPLMYVNPAVGRGEISAFLVYTSIGCGHYDAAIPYPYTIKQSTVTAKLDSTKTCISCGCGVNNQPGRKSFTLNTAYATRCKCYKNHQQCSSFCRCKDCNNPYGKRPVMQSSAKRQRRPHSLQINIPSSKKFALDRGESLSESIWSDFESIVLDDICHITSEDDNSNTDVVKLYNDIVEYSKSTFCTIILPKDAVFRNKSSNQISAKIAFQLANC